MATRIVAVVLAGGAAGRLARHEPEEPKALVPFGDVPLVAWVLRALQASRVVERLVVVGPDDVGRLARTIVPAERLGCVMGGERLADSLALGLGAASALDPERLLVVTADLPWLTGAQIDAFVRTAPDADLVYTAVERAAMERAFPRQERTYARVAGRDLTGGNVLLLRPAVVPALLPLVDRAYRARKSPFALAALLGWDLALRLLLRRLTIAAAERRVSRLLNATARVVLDVDPAIAADVDRPEHLAFRPPEEGPAVGENA
jgi:CTP:molybdopterin cytidylyltransferase MocA